MILKFASLSTAVASGAFVACGTPAPQPPSALQVLAGAHRAVDEEGALADVRFVRFVAAASGLGGDYRVTMSSTVHGAARLVFSTGLSAGINDDEAWVRFDPAATPQALTDTLETFVRGHDLWMNLLYPQARYGALSLAGEGPFAETAAIRLDGLDALGAPIEFYYALADTLPLGFRVVDHLRGRGPVTTTVFDWEERDGVRVPLGARFVQGDEIFEYEMSLFEVGREAPQDAFDVDR